MSCEAIVDLRESILGTKKFANLFVHYIYNHNFYYDILGSAI